MNNKSRIVKELNSSTAKEDGARTIPPAPIWLMPRRRRTLDLAVASKRQTHEQQRQFSAALDGFLAEWVRQHLGPQR